jgi:hypothetical protein
MYLFDTTCGRPRAENCRTSEFRRLTGYAQVTFQGTTEHEQRFTHYALPL